MDSIKNYLIENFLLENAYNEIFIITDIDIDSQTIYLDLYESSDTPPKGKIQSIAFIKTMLRTRKWTALKLI